MGALWEHGTSNSIVALLSSALIRGIQVVVIGGSMETESRMFRNLWSPLLNVDPRVVRMSGMLVTQSSLGSPGVSLDDPVTV